MRIAAAVCVFAFSVWVAWPMLTFQNYPHLPILRSYFSMGLLILAHHLIPRRTR